MTSEVVRPKHRCLFCGDTERYMVAVDVSDPFKPAVCEQCLELCSESIRAMKEKRK